jgi:hypothetical protein
MYEKYLNLTEISFALTRLSVKGQSKGGRGRGLGQVGKTRVMQLTYLVDLNSLKGL